ncbi:NAD(P)-dependent oxidoreductase [Halorubellus sp. PRR65]|uniref:NAD(P)-dependent oxidoreductase n=1 Tax=Halorubellus sp. PRR65 TaxID=3098148 RepID=UPI002B263EDF|nr:NAD(P)-dependent oxidoreductase [Halorubellus sp. PRR65]
MVRVFVSDGMGMLEGLESMVAEASGGDVEFAWAVVDEVDALTSAAAGADVLVVGPDAPVTRAVLAAVDPTVVVRAGVGVDNVDVEAAAELGVAVTNTPSYCREEVGEHALALTLAAARRLSTYDRQTRNGEWDWRGAVAPRRLAASTVGFVGFGAIARAAAPSFVALFDEAVAYDPYVDAALAAEHGVALADFEAVCERADALVVSAPLTDETRGLVDADALAALPEDAVVVNVGRGAIVDADALAAALDDGPVAAAALDVLPTEPPVDSPLVGRDDVLVTPHAAWCSVEAATDLLETVASTVAAVVDGDAVPERVRVT